ncbi:MAG: hypothetical protein ABIR47_05040 [Candidatus Kapaibacterium sp.]
MSALCVAITTCASAQTGMDLEHTDASGRMTCGTIPFNDGKEMEAVANTARNNPAVYQQMMAAARSKENRRRIAGDEYPFFVRDRNTNQYATVNATLMYDGRYAQIWVDNVDTVRVKKATIATLGKALDSSTAASSRNPSQGIIQNDIDVFGNYRDQFSQDGKIWFLMTDIKDGFSGGAFVAGFFSPWDQTSQPGSNQLNMLYIDSHEGLGSQSPSNLRDLMNTLAHEFQHLIHYYTNNQSEVFFNEGCSETASIINGYANRDNSGYLANTNVSLFRWTYEDATGNLILADYARAMNFVYYLYDQYGEGFLHAFNQTRSTGMKRIDDALNVIGVPPSWQEILKGFAVANYSIKNVDYFRYRYNKPISTGSPKADAVALKTAGSVSVAPYAISYFMLSKPTPQTLRFTSTGQTPYAIMATYYKGTSVIEVKELAPNSDYTIGGTAAYDKVVFAMVNLLATTSAPANVNISWTTAVAVAGVDDATAGNSGLALTGIAPTPSAGSATISFVSSGSAPLTLQIFDASGSLARTVIDGDQISAGAHQIPVSTDGMANGVYMVRLLQGAAMVNSRMVVIK